MSPDLLRQQKAASRTRLRAAIAALSDEEKAAQSRLICQRLPSQPAWQNARNLLLYWPLPDEPDIRPLIEQCLAEGKTVLLPRFVQKTALYEAARVQSTTHDLHPGRFGISEPNPNCPSFNLKQLDFTLLPGIGFSVDRRRLGRGRGYYDRLLAQVSGITCGVAFNQQLTVEIPIESHDKTLSCILTPSTWLAD